MADDVLARFEDPSRRGQGAAAAAQPGGAAGLPEYVAFEVQDKLISVDIERAAAPWRCPLLKYYLDISYSPKFYSGFTVFFTYMSVRVKGKNLKDVVDAFRLGKCTCIREYHPALFTAPPAEGKPVIESIELVVRPLHEAMDESEQQPE